MNDFLDSDVKKKEVSFIQNLCALSCGSLIEQMSFWRRQNRWRLTQVHSLKPSIFFAPENLRFSHRNLQTSRGPLFSGVNSLLVSGRGTSLTYIS